HALMARCGSHPGPVRPTLVVDRTLTPGPTTLDAYAATQLAGLHATYAGHLVHAELTRGPVPALDLALAIDHLGLDLTIVQRHLWPGDGSAVVATGSCADPDWPTVSPDLLAAVRSLRPAPAL
ncbi:MAG TPA: hypothetical protein VH479_07625, partial [Acidimicrobiales bacterium]